MAEIKAADVAKLRQMTSAGMMDCKNALIEANGDFERAQEIIREKGKLVAAKRADRETSEGAVIAKVTPDGKNGIVVCLSCETDFVAKNDQFTALANQIADAALKALPEDLEALKATKIGDKTIDAIVTEQTGKSGEKTQILYYAKLSGEFLVPYIHMNNKLASLVLFSKVIPMEAAKDIAMQVAAMNPVAVDKTKCAPDVVEKEKQIGREQARMEGKPENMIEKIAEGKLNKFYKEFTLIEQAFIKEQKQTVADYLKSVDKDVQVVEFRRFSLND